MCSRHLASILVAILLLVAAPAPARAQAELDAETYNGLIKALLDANDSGRFKEAERYARQIKANDERYDPDKFAWEMFLGLALRNQGRYGEARPLLESYVKHCKQTYGDELRTVEGLMTLGALYLDTDLYNDAARVLDEAVKMGVRTVGADHELTLNAQGNLALVFQNQGDWSRAVPLYNDIINRQHRLNQRTLEHLIPIGNLMLIYQYQGRYELAEAMGRYGLSIAKSLGLPSKHPRTIVLLERLGMTYQMQHRAAEARPILEQALQAADSLLGADHPQVGSICHNLSVCYTDLGEREKSRRLLKRAIGIYSAVYGADHPRLCPMYCALGWDHIDDDNFVEAEKVLRLGLEIATKTNGGNDQAAAELRTLLADSLYLQGKLDDAEKELQQALRDLEALGSDQTRRHDLHRLQARALWQRGDQAGAIAQLQKAIEVVDASRAFTGGSEVERASYYSKFNFSHELLLGWQAKLGDLPGAFATLEQARARTFLESINQAGIDLWAGRSPEEKTRGQQRQVELNSKVSRLQTQWLEFPAPTPQEKTEVQQERRQLARELQNARDALYEFERDLRSSSQAYRQLISTQPKVYSLAEVQRRLVPEKTLLLSYLIGSSNSYLLAVTSTGVELFELQVTEQDAAPLELEAGPLTRDDLRKVLLGDGKTAVLPRLAKSAPLGDVEAKLHRLWHLLIPEKLRGEITGGSLERLIIVPDGPLALLPLEALVIEPSPGVEYLLDKAPPMEYGPSAAVLITLADRPVTPAKKEAVLTVGDPLYGRAGATSSGLKPLPFTGTESRWVVETFRKAGVESVQFLGGTATEANVRSHIAGREIVHLACHGSSDDSYGNFFGALSIAPGQKVGNPQDDGELTLAEINGLDLRSCQLAILSACLTNHGPQQRGEGVWTLSRGFLVAGARRVVASDWVIDDAAGGSLISVFCSRLAQDRQKEVSPDYAKALRDAKRWTRQQEKWSHPYFWAPFVFVGPH